jgi:hypothetical protein
MTYPIAGLYEITAITNADGTPHEREARRKSQRIGIGLVRIGEPMIAVYPAEEAYLQTSNVVDYYVNERVLIVMTRNSTYKFRRVVTE